MCDQPGRKEAAYALGHVSMLKRSMRQESTALAIKCKVFTYWQNVGSYWKCVDKLKFSKGLCEIVSIDALDKKDQNHNDWFSTNENQFFIIQDLQQVKRE